VGCGYVYFKNGIGFVEKKVLEKKFWKKGWHKRSGKRLGEQVGEKVWRASSLGVRQDSAN
jgi:hypothetical protein